MNVLQRKIQLHPLMLTVVLALIGLIIMINPLRDWWTWRSLESEGQVRAARLTNTDERTGRLGGSEYHVRYEVASYAFEQQVSPELYEEIRLKPEINVLVLPDDPETARIVGAKPQHAVDIIRGLLVILLGVLLWLLWEWQIAVRGRP